MQETWHRRKEVHEACQSRHLSKWEMSWSDACALAMVPHTNGTLHPSLAAKSQGVVLRTGCIVAWALPNMPLAGLEAAYRSRGYKVFIMLSMVAPCVFWICLVCPRTRKYCFLLYLKYRGPISIVPQVQGPNICRIGVFASCCMITLPYKQRIRIEISKAVN